MSTSPQQSTHRQRPMTPLARLAALWYFCAAPAESRSDSLDAREKMRRGRVASWILLLILGLDLLPIFGVLGKPTAIITLLVVFVIDVFAVLLNRTGRLIPAGIIAIFTIEFGLLGTLFSVPGGASPLDLPLFDILLQAVVVGSVMLSPLWGLIIMILNVGIIWSFLHFGPLSPDLARLFRERSFSMQEQAYVMQISIAILLFIVVSSDNAAVRRADRAETIVELEKKIALEQGKQLEEKTKLEEDIASILQAFQQFNNGISNVRVPVSQERTLFQVSYSLNNLFARLISAKQQERQLQNDNTRLREALLSRQPAQTSPASATRQEETEVALRILADHLRRGTFPDGASGTSVDEIVTLLKGANPPRTGFPRR